VAFFDDQFKKFGLSDGRRERVYLMLLSAYVMETLLMLSHLILPSAVMTMAAPDCETLMKVHCLVTVSDLWVWENFDGFFCVFSSRQMGSLFSGIQVQSAIR
jgi:hypothetical protein